MSDETNTAQTLAGEPLSEEQHNNVQTWLLDMGAECEKKSNSALAWKFNAAAVYIEVLAGDVRALRSKLENDDSLVKKIEDQAYEKGYRDGYREGFNARD